MSLTADNRLLRIYEEHGAPTFWRDMAGHGELHRAIYNYQHSVPLNAEQLDRIVDYCDYAVNAPCWTRPLPDGTPRTVPSPEILRAIRDSVKQVVTLDDFDTWLAAAQVAGLDPL